MKKMLKGMLSQHPGEVKKTSHSGKTSSLLEAATIARVGQEKSDRNTWNTSTLRELYPGSGGNVALTKGTTDKIIIITGTVK